VFANRKLFYENILCIDPPVIWHGMWGLHYAGYKMVLAEGYRSVFET